MAEQQDALAVQPDASGVQVPLRAATHDLLLIAAVIYAGKLGNYHTAPDASGENRGRLMASAIEDALALEVLVSAHLGNANNISGVRECNSSTTSSAD